MIYADSVRLPKMFYMNFTHGVIMINFIYELSDNLSKMYDKTCNSAIHNLFLRVTYVSNNNAWGKATTFVFAKNVIMI